MSRGRIFPPRIVNNTGSKPSGHTESSFASTEKFGESKSETRSRMDLRTVVQRRFMSMMEVHDRMRVRVLGSTPGSYSVSGD